MNFIFYYLWIFFDFDEYRFSKIFSFWQNIFFLWVQSYIIFQAYNVVYQNIKFDENLSLYSIIYLNYEKCICIHGQKHIQLAVLMCHLLWF